MKEMQLFFESNEVRTTMVDGESWWLLKDVCAVLEIINHNEVQHRLDDDEVMRFNLPHHRSTNKEIEAVYINESGLYATILRSDKPNARRFRKWITSVALPSIRKYGAHIEPHKLAEISADPAANARLIESLQNEIKREQYKYEALEKENKKLKEKVNAKRGDTELIVDLATAEKEMFSFTQFFEVMSKNGESGDMYKLAHTMCCQKFLTEEHKPTPKANRLDMFRYTINERGRKSLWITLKGAIYYSSRQLVGEQRTAAARDFYALKGIRPANADGHPRCITVDDFAAIVGKYAQDIRYRDPNEFILDLKHIKKWLKKDTAYHAPMASGIKNGFFIPVEHNALCTPKAQKYFVEQLVEIKRIRGKCYRELDAVSGGKLLEESGIIIDD